MNNKDLNQNSESLNADKGKEKAEKLVEQIISEIEGGGLRQDADNEKMNAQNKGNEKLNTQSEGNENPNAQSEGNEKLNAQNGVNEKPNAQNLTKAEPYLDSYAEIEGGTKEIDASKQREKRMKTLLWSCVFIVSVFILVVLVALLWDKSKVIEPVDLLEPTVFTPVNVFSDSVKPFVADDVVFPEGIQEKFKPAYAVEQSFVGWMYVPNTSIDMPIYQSKDNVQYLKNNIWGEFSDFGVVFMDYRNNIENMSRNTILYGHNYDLTDDDKYTDLQFGEIEQYRKLDFYKQNPVIEFDTLYENKKWKVIACFVTNGITSGDVDGNKEYIFAYHTPNMNDESFMEYIDEISQRSFIHTGVDVLPTDKVLTLSTCTHFFDRHGRIQNARCALVARMVRDGESDEVDVSLAKKNENIRFPQLYYDVFGGTNPHRNTPKWYPKY